MSSSELSRVSGIVWDIKESSSTDENKTLSLKKLGDSIGVNFLTVEEETVNDKTTRKYDMNEVIPYSELCSDDDDDDDNMFVSDVEIVQDVKTKVNVMESNDVDVITNVPETLTPVNECVEEGEKDCWLFVIYLLFILF